MQQRPTCNSLHTHRDDFEMSGTIELLNKLVLRYYYAAYSFCLAHNISAIGVDTPTVSVPCTTLM